MPSGNSPVISPFPPVRRVVTGHTSDGKAVFLEDKTVPTVLYSPEPGGSLKADLYRTEEFPSANSVDHVESKNEELVSDGGSTLRAWDIPPHSASASRSSADIILFMLTVPFVTLASASYRLAGLCDRHEGYSCLSARR